MPVTPAPLRCHRMTPLHRLQLLWMTAFLFCTACGPPIAPLKNATQKGYYDVALTYARGNRDLEVYLATAVVERAAADSAMPKPFVLALAPENRWQRDALDRLRNDTDNVQAAQLARIVRHRNARFSHNPARALLVDSEFSDVRALAATTLAHNLDRKTLHELVRDINGTVRGAAVAALCRLTVSAKTEKLLAERLRKDPLPHVRATAARCGVALGANGAQLLKTTIINDANSGVQQAAMKGLLTIAGQKEVAWLTRYSDGPMTLSRVHAAAELAHLNLPQGKSRLRNALGAGTPEVVVEAISLLQYGRVDPVDALLMPLLKGPQKISTAAAAALLQRGIHVPESTEVLLTNWYQGDLTALAVLVRTGQEAAVKHVRHQLKTEKNIQTIIEQFAGVTALRADFVSLLAHPDQRVRVAAAMAVLQQSRK